MRTLREFSGDYCGASVSRDSSLEIGSYFWLRKVERLLHATSPDRDRPSAEVYLLVSVLRPVLRDSSGVDWGRRRAKKRAGCVTAVNWSRLSPYNILEKEGEGRGLFPLQRLSVRGYREVKKSIPSLAVYPSLFPSLWSGGICHRRSDLVVELFRVVFVWSRFCHLRRLDSGLVPPKRQVRGYRAPVWWIYFTGCLCVMPSVGEVERENVARACDWSVRVR